jgi:hypothetical protein
MIGNTITLDWGDGDTVVPLVNEGGYSSEYRYTDGNGITTKLNIRHSTESPNPDGNAYDRHNVTITQLFPAEDGFPKGYQVQAYFILRALPKNADFVSGILAALIKFASVTPTADLGDMSIADRVIAWES